MSAGSRILTCFYAAVALWLAYCTVRTWGSAAAWSSAAMAVASLLVVVAMVREIVIAHERRTVAALCGRKERHLAWRWHAAEVLAQEEVEAAACCERWWSSLGIDHDTGCAHQTPRSNAA
jgi:hypothetical protein